jgi:hypothetical protein
MGVAGPGVTAVIDQFSVVRPYVSLSENLLHEFRWSTGQPLDSFRGRRMRREQVAETHPAYKRRNDE